MEIDRKVIGPDEAKELLSHNTRNRLVSDKLVKRFASDMTRGQFRFIGDPIRISSYGTLLDGQHRLLAVIKSRTKQEFIVITGLDPETQSVMDIGRSRQIGDVLRINGEKHHNLLAAALGYVWGMDNGVDFAINQVNWRPTVSQMLETLDLHPGIRNSCTPGHQLYNHMKLAGSIATFCHYRFGLIDPLDRDDFWGRLVRRDFRGDTDPLGQVYVKLLADAADRQKRMDTITKHALFVKAWNYYRSGAEVKTLKWTRGGRSREAFPEPL